MALQDPSLDVIVDGTHSLIDVPCPAYSNMTVRRAFIVWLYCGQVNKFKDVCNYYHHLEAMEDKLSPSQRAASRHHEFTMFVDPPPTSPFLEAHFPKLYSNDPIDPVYIKKLESIKNEKFVFKLEGFNDIKLNSVGTTEIIQTSKNIRKYCKIKQCTLRKFLQDFKEYATRCNLKETVYNIACYIKRKELESELKFFRQYPPEFSFLNSTTDEIVDDISETSNYLNANQVDIETTNMDETIQLKLILGVPPATSSPKKAKNKENINKSNTEDGKYNSAQEFFKSFSNYLEATTLNDSANSYSPLMPKIEDFVRMYDNQKQKSRSVDGLEEGKGVKTSSFSSQEFFDASLAKISDLKIFRKI